MHRTPLLMIPPLRGAKPPFGGPIKNGVATILVSLRIPPLDFGGNAGRKFLSNEEYRPNITWLPLFSAILFFIGAHETRQNDLPLRGKTARAGCLTSYLVLVLFTSRDGSFRSSALFFSSLHFPLPFFFLSRKRRMSNLVQNWEFHRCADFFLLQEKWREEEGWNFWI